MVRNTVMLVLLVAFIGISAPATEAQQNIHYIREGAGGNGSSWADAWSELPANLERGHTYYVADGEYPHCFFNDDVDNPSDPQYIYIRKATEEEHGESSTWDSSYGDGVAVFDSPIQFSTPYWEFSGRKRDGLGSGHGFRIDATDGDKGIKIVNSSSASHIRIEYIEIAGCGDDGNSHSNDLVYITKPVKNVVFSYCHLHDAGRCPFLFRNCSGMIEHCYMARNESTPAQHAEGISAAWNTTWIIRYNFWEDMEGTGFIVFYGDHWEIYGNVFYYTENSTTSPTISNGSITTWTDPNDGNVNNSKIYNNTFVGLSGFNAGIQFNTASYANEAYNNVFYDCQKINHKYVDVDWNWYYAIGAGNYQGEPHGEYPAEDPDIFADPSRYDFRLTKDTVNGKDDLGEPYNLDMLDEVRGADDTWDRGAYEYAVNLDPPENIGIVF